MKYAQAQTKTFSQHGLLTIFLCPIERTYDPNLNSFLSELMIHCNNLEACCGKTQKQKEKSGPVFWLAVKTELGKDFSAKAQRKKKNI